MNESLSMLKAAVSCRGLCAPHVLPPLCPISDTELISLRGQMSQAEQDIVKSYNLSANAYVAKPVDLNQFLSAVKAIEGFWLEIVKLPPNEK